MHRVQTHHDVLDLLAEKVQKAKDTRRLAETLFTLLDAKSVPLRTAAANGDRDSQLFLGRLDLLRKQLHASVNSVRMLNAVQAAERLRLIKPDGTPRDSAYNVIEKAGGQKIAGKWTIAEGDLDTYLRGGGR